MSVQMKVSQRYQHIYLDNVKELGECIELETVVKDISIEKVQKEHNEVIKLLETKQY